MSEPPLKSQVKNARTNVLNTEDRIFIVSKLAMFEKPEVVRKQLKAMTGKDITLQSVQHYDPTKKRRTKKQKLAQQWYDLFAKVRKAFTENIEDTVPMANKAVRIRDLAHAAEQFKAKKNYIGMAKMLEQIAKEVGNVHTNVRELTGKDGGPIKYQEVGDMTDEQIYDELRSMGIDPAKIHTPPEGTQ